MIAAALSIQDPRERPVEKRQAADASHALTGLRLPAYLKRRTIC